MLVIHKTESARGSNAIVITRHRSIFAILVLTLFFLAGFSRPQGNVSASPPSSWSNPFPIEQYTGLDLTPTVLQAINGSTWLSWESNRYHINTGVFDILYKTMMPNGTWLATSRLTSSGQNQSPTMAQLSNGTIFLFWSHKSTSNYQLNYKRFNVDTHGNEAWSSTVQITSTSLNDTQPSTTINGNGTMWLVWTRHNQTSTCSSCAISKQLYYKTLKGKVWSAEAQLTSDTNWNFGSSITVATDGIVRVVWSKGPSAQASGQIYYKTYNGTSWSSETQIVSSPGVQDADPSILQDRNGTIWLFWDRLVTVSTNIAYVVYNQFSIDNGKSWLGQSPMTPIICQTSGCLDSKMPSAVQSRNSDHALWLFYSTDDSNGVSSPTGFDIWALKSAAIYPVHHVALSFFSAYTSVLYAGGMKSVGQSSNVTISVAVQDLGDFNENVSVSLTATNKTSINLGTLMTSVQSGSFATLFFNWNTTGAKPARYGIIASVAPVAGETVGNSGDNSRGLANQVHLLPRGDVDQDGGVDLNDIAVFFYAYGATPGTPRWNPYCDLNNQGYIDLNEIAVSVYNYGTFT